MTTSDSFFVYLPSNVNTEGQYPNNNAAHFTVPLADPLILSSKWETRLSEIFFLSYNYNIPHPLNTQVKVWFPIKDECLHKFIAIPKGQYDALEYTKAVNKEIRAIKFRHKGEWIRSPFLGKLKYNSQSKKIMICLKKGEGIHFYNEMLRNMIGFAHGHSSHIKCHWHLDGLNAELPHPCSFNINGSHMYVYTSLVEYSQVGNVYAPLMRVVGLDEKAHTEIVHREYKNAHYLCLRSNIISSIEIKLANGLGEEIKFKQGNLILVLHFRKRKSS